MHRQSPVIFNSCMSQFSIFCSTSQSFPMVRRPWNKMQEGLGYITSIQNLKIFRKKLFVHLGILVEQILIHLTIKTKSSYTWLSALFKNFEFFHHVIVAGGLDPWLLHSKRKSRPADSGSLLVRIRTFSGRTEIQKNNCIICMVLVWWSIHTTF